MSAIKIIRKTASLRESASILIRYNGVRSGIFGGSRPRELAPVQWRLKQARRCMDIRELFSYVHGQWKLSRAALNLVKMFAHKTRISFSSTKIVYAYLKERILKITYSVIKLTSKLVFT